MEGVITLAYPKIALEIFDDELYHYGMPRRSGRYPWGSGEDPYQHSQDFLSRYENLESKGLSEKEIAEQMKMSTAQLRVQKSYAVNQRRALRAKTAQSLKDHGYNNVEIAEKMGLPGESSVRSLLKESSKIRMNQAQTTADLIKKIVDEKGMVDVSTGVDRELGISDTKLKEALYILELQGYKVQSGRIPQVTNPEQQTTQRVIGPPTMKPKDIYNYDQVHSLNEYKSSDEGETYHKAFTYPESLDSKRLSIRYNEEGGLAKDGLIEIRRGCKDLDLQGSNYAQVRIMVDGKSYLKGMAVYGDPKDFSKGADVIFNTNKTKGTPQDKVLKPIKDDPENPFGSAIKDAKLGGQYWYEGSDGKQHLGLINKRADEGDWGEWSKNIPHQFLEKQPKELIKKQLNLTVKDKQAELLDIEKITNPVVKRYYLEQFADECDKNSVTLKAASLPRQRYQVILPLTTLKDAKNNNDYAEVYAPNYKDGEKVALVRYPHAGTFEIPICIVNNKNSEGQRMLGKTPSDAIGITKKTADRLSGADFDGDTVQVIPCNSRFSKVNIMSTPELPGLKGFDPGMEYGTEERTVTKTNRKTGETRTVKEYYNSNSQKVNIMSESNKQKQMGVVSNLITDMTIKGASPEELARAVRHSMVVIDAVKHKYDVNQSYVDNNIEGLKNKYQLDPETGKNGVSTLLSRAKSPVYIVEEKTNQYTGRTYKKSIETTQMAITDDARTLSSGTVKENIYAEFANTMKGMAKQSRAESKSLELPKVNAKAREEYADEVNSLNAKIRNYDLNAPRERQAQRMANVEVANKKALAEEAGTSLTKKEIGKIAQQSITKYRAQYSAERKSISLTDREIEAIKKGAISSSKLNHILYASDPDKLRESFMPKSTLVMTEGKIMRAKALKEAGYTTEQIAQTLNVSTSTVNRALKPTAQSAQQIKHAAVLEYAF